jgi:hypothetical protein
MYRVSRYSLPIILVLAFSVPSTSVVAQQPRVLSDEEMAQVVAAVFAVRYPQQKDQETDREIFVLPRNLRTEWTMAPGSGFKVTMTRVTELEQRDPRKYLYFEFGAFSWAGTEVTTTLTERWRDGIAFGRSESQYTCRKVDGKWQAEEGERSFEIYN